MTLRKIRIISLSFVGAGALGGIVFAYFEINTIAWICCAIMIIAYLFHYFLNRCPECRGHLRGYESYCPHCGLEIDVNKKLW